MKRILALDLFSGIWPHALLVTKALGQLDANEFEVQLLSCGELFPDFCTVRESRKRTFPTTPRTASIDCSDCKFSAKLAGNFLNSINVGRAHSGFLSAYTTAEMKAEARFIESQISLSDSSLDFELSGVPVVRFALYETIIKFKKLDLRLNEIEMRYFKTLLYNCVITTLAGQRYLDLQGSFAAVIMYSPEYGPNNCFAALASARGIPIYSIRGSSNLSEMGSSVMIWRWDFRPEVYPFVSSWPGWKGVVISPKDRQRLKRHKRELVSSKSPFVNSSSFNPKSTSDVTLKKLGVGSAKRIILMSLSSTDEVFASKIIGRGPAVSYPGKVFKNQFEWVLETINWVKSRPELTLVVRLHPRDLPNKRESVLSEQFSRWQAILADLPQNVVINQPAQDISFREACSISDVLVTGWSSTAIEAMLLDKPVVTYDRKLVGFPEDIHLTGDSKETYLANLETALETLDLSHQSQMADAWLTHYVVRGSIRLTGGIFGTARSSGPEVFRKIFSGVDRYLPWFWRPLELLLSFRKSPEAWRMNRILDGQANSSFEL